MAQPQAACYSKGNLIDCNPAAGAFKPLCFHGDEMKKIDQISLDIVADAGRQLESISANDRYRYCLDGNSSVFLGKTASLSPCWTSTENGVVFVKKEDDGVRFYDYGYAIGDLVFVADPVRLASKAYAALMEIEKPVIRSPKR